MADEKYVKRIIVREVELPEGPATKLLESVGLTRPVLIPVRWLAKTLSMTEREVMDMIDQREADDAEAHNQRRRRAGRDDHRL